MSSYPIIHTKNNPVKILVIQDYISKIKSYISQVLGENDYVEIHDLKVNYLADGMHSCVMLYKTKYKGEVSQ